MSISSYCLIFISLFSICFNETSYKDDGLVLTLDPFDISNFIINKYYPNQNLDLDYYSLRLDGSTNFPLYQSIPGKIGFDRDTDGTISELKYKQRKTDKYFDTSIFLKKDINIKTDFLLQLETKSIIDNINQNAFFDYRMIDENLILEISYLYHYENDPDFYSLIDPFFYGSAINQNSSKINESFNSGISFTYFKNKFSYKADFALQTSYVDRPSFFDLYDSDRIEYDHQTSWVNISAIYHLSQVLEIYFENKYKKNILEHHSTSELLFNEYFNLLFYGIKYIAKDVFVLNFGVDNYDGMNKPNFNISYNKNKILLELGIENFIVDKALYDNGIYYNYNMLFTEKYNSRFTYDSNRMSNSLEIGKIINNSYRYNYFLSKGKASVWKIELDYTYNNYYNLHKGDLSIKSYLDYGIAYFPFKDQYKFEMYAKINYYQYELNSSVDLLSLDLFDNYNLVKSNVKLYNLSIGFVFDSFAISYKFKNGLTNGTLNNYIIYSENMNNFGHLNYIEIEWIFED